MKGQLLNSTTTETWEQPGRNDDGICIPRDVDGNRLTLPGAASRSRTPTPTASRPR